MVADVSCSRPNAAAVEVSSGTDWSCWPSRMVARTDPSTSPSFRRPTSMLSTASSAAPRHCRRHDGGCHQLEGMLRIVVQNAQIRCPQHAHEAWACAGLVSWSSRLVSIGTTCGDAKIVPVVEAAGHAGQRCARVLVLRPLDPPRARSWRLHRRRRRRRVAIWRSRAGGWTVPRRRRLSPSGAVSNVDFLTERRCF